MPPTPRAISTCRRQISTSCSKTVRFRLDSSFGATVRGPAHVADAVLNQDAWSHATITGTRVVVISDGMGSKPHARDGAKAACSAVVDAVRQWQKHPDAPTNILLALIHLLWRARVSPRQPSDCACTCLFALGYAHGGGLAAQLGDGLLMLRTDDGLIPLSKREEGVEFSNETHALGITNGLAAWSETEFGDECSAVILCTDGVSEDLLPDKLDEFESWLLNDIQPLPAVPRRFALANALLNWPTPRHTDDKTIAMLYAEAER